MMLLAIKTSRIKEKLFLPMVLTKQHSCLIFRALIPQIVNMHFQSVGLCLGLLFITVNAEFMNDGVEVEDVSENPEESSVKEDDPSSGVRRLRSEL